MPNVDNAFGLRPVRHMSGAPYNGAVNMYCILTADGTATFIGDAVKSSGSAANAGTTINGLDLEGMPEVIQAAAGNNIRGVVVGFLPLQTDLSVRHRKASTGRVALVADDPDLVFEIQENSSGSTVGVASVGLHADVIVGSGDATTGMSKMELDSDSVQTTTTQANLRILRMSPRQGNVVGSFCKWEVIISEHELANKLGTGT